MNFITEDGATNVPKVACKDKNSPAAVVRPQNEGSKYHPKMQNKIRVHTVKGKKQTQDPFYCTGGGRKTIYVSSWVRNTLKFTKKLHSGIPTSLFPPSPSAAPHHSIAQKDPIGGRAGEMVLINSDNLSSIRSPHTVPHRERKELPPSKCSQQMHNHIYHTHTCAPHTPIHTQRLNKYIFKILA